MSTISSKLLVPLIINIICVFGGLVGPITIIENGKPITRYIVSTDPSSASTDGSQITLQHNSNVQISANASNDYSPYMFVRYNLDGATVSFIADYSEVSCSCNGAFYIVNMPGLDSNGNPMKGNSGNYYCDANGINGAAKCWDIDIMEANMYVIQTTLHACNNTPGMYINNCDTLGCGSDTWSHDDNGFCPNNTCVINTNKPFNFSITFNSSDTYHVKITQMQTNNMDNYNINTMEYDICGNKEYIENMKQALDYGMTIVMSFWGDDYNTMSWLDDMTGCNGNCNQSGKLIFTDIAISNYQSNKQLVINP